MTRMELKSRIGADGMLTLQLPIGLADANREVKVIVEPLAEPATEGDQEEWKRFVAETAGCWQGAPLARPEQGEFETRQEWA